MAVEFVAVKCPACGAGLNVEGDREFSFCTYCGSKIVMTNSNEHIYRNIDEAKVKEAETDRMIRMRQLEMEEKNSVSKKKLLLFWIIGTAVFVILGIIGISIGNEGLEMCMMIGMMMGFGGLVKMLTDDPKSKKKAKQVMGPNEVLITESMVESTCGNFNVALTLFENAGFTNIKTIPLNDLNLLTQKLNGKVDEITINGEYDFEDGDIFQNNAKVLITYHSTK